MEKYDLSDRQLKVLVILAMALIGWLCVKAAAARHAPAARLLSSPMTVTPNAGAGQTS